MDAQRIFRAMFSPDAGQALAERPAFSHWQSSAHQFHHVGAGDVMLSPVTQSRAYAPSIAQPPVSMSLVDQQGRQVQQPPQQQPPPPQGETPAPAQAPRSDTGGTSTTTMLLLGGAAFVAVMLILKRKK